ncbi:hypothetical protein ES707_14303 [subsurface metagenome]
MKDAAHAESLEHEVFQKPFKVEPEFEYRDTPPNYHRRHLGEGKLPDKMKVWRVQDHSKVYGKIPNSVVACAYGFTDSLDAEVLAKGFNTGKEYGAVGVGRHGNYLQWGYSLPPSKMTDAGRKFFLNCICYINKFDGKAPLIRRTSTHRLDTMRLARSAEALWQRRKNDESFLPFIPEDLTKKFSGDPNGLVQYYKDNLEFIYRDRQFHIDSELKSLGLNSNRSLDTLERLIGLLQDDTHADTARRLLTRYTNQSFQSADDWKRWFEDNRDRIFFSDVGGYKFLVIPEGYLDKK